MNCLRDSIETRNWEDVEWHYDNVLSALMKALGLKDDIENEGVSRMIFDKWCASRRASLERALLRSLREDGDSNGYELAQRVSVPGERVIRALHQLEAEGIITSYWDNPRTIRIGVLSGGPVWKVYRVLEKD